MKLKEINNASFLNAYFFCFKANKKATLIDFWLFWISFWCCFTNSIFLTCNYSREFYKVQQQTPFPNFFIKSFLLFGSNRKEEKETEEEKKGILQSKVRDIDILRVY